MHTDTYAEGFHVCRKGQACITPHSHLYRDTFEDRCCVCVCAHDTYNLSTPFPLVLQHHPHTQLSSCRSALRQRKTHLLFYARAAIYKHIYAHGSTFSALEMWAAPSTSYPASPWCTQPKPKPSLPQYGVIDMRCLTSWDPAFSRLLCKPVAPPQHPQERCGSQQPWPGVFDTQMGSVGVPAMVSFKNSIRRTEEEH